MVDSNAPATGRRPVDLSSNDLEWLRVALEVYIDSEKFHRLSEEEQVEVMDLKERVENA